MMFGVGFEYTTLVTLKEFASISYHVFTKSFLKKIMSTEFSQIIFVPLLRCLYSFDINMINYILIFSNGNHFFMSRISQTWPEYRFCSLHY